MASWELGTWKIPHVTFLQIFTAMLALEGNTKIRKKRYR